MVTVIEQSMMQVQVEVNWMLMFVTWVILSVIVLVKMLTVILLLRMSQIGIDARSITVC